jgi:hypothetical protein
VIHDRYSDVLQMYIQYDTESGELFTADGVVYSSDELRRITNCTDKDKRLIHKIKFEFDGVVI